MTAGVVEPVARQAVPDGGERAGQPRLMRVSAALVVLLFAFVVLRLAWFGDDWLITLRTALNAQHGNGLVYNVGERVEAYSHPLWFLVIWLLGAATGSWVYSMIVVSVGLAAAALSLLLFRVRTWPAFAMVGLVALTSNTVLTWSTGGLEGALAAFLLCLLVAAAPTGRDGPVRFAVWGATVALFVLTRLDLALLVLPFVAGIVWTLRAHRRLLATAGLGLGLPLLLWFGFSWWYYGSLFPNTFLAKTNVEIGRTALVEQGFAYLRYSGRIDAIVWIPIVAALLAAVITRSARAWWLIAGAGLYVLYVVGVGGDFMAGRFLLLPVVASLAAVVEASRQPIRRGPVWTAGLAVLCALTIQLAVPNSLLVKAQPNELAVGYRGIVDERVFWVVASHTNVSPLYPSPATPPAVVDMDAASIERQAEAWTRWDPAVPMDTQVHYAVVGYWGIRGGPGVHIIDLCGLTDRFLAMQTFVPSPPAPGAAADPNAGPDGWRIGHFGRTLPVGYDEAVRWSDPGRLQDPTLQNDLRRLWSRIRP